MRGALVALVLLTTILIVAADIQKILDSNDDLDTSNDSELYLEDDSATSYSHIDTDVKSKSDEVENRNLVDSPNQNVFFYAKGYSSADREVMAKALEDESNKLKDAYKRNQTHFYYGTECYSCVGCNEVGDFTDLKTCPRSSDISKQNKCIVYVEKFSNVARPWYIRACASERETCAEMKQAYYNYQKQGVVTLLSCEECEGNRCNGSPRSRSSLVSVGFFVIIAPLIAKCTLS